MTDCIVQVQEAVSAFRKFPKTRRILRSEEETFLSKMEVCLLGRHFHVCFSQKHLSLHMCRRVLSYTCFMIPVQPSCSSPPFTIAQAELVVHCLLLGHDVI